MRRLGLARRSVRLVAQILEDRETPALFGPIDYSLNVGTNPNHVAVADLNADGRLDLAVTNIESSNVTILLGDGSGGFSAATGSPLAVENHPFQAAVGDFNGDLILLR